MKINVLIGVEFADVKARTLETDKTGCGGDGGPQSGVCEYGGQGGRGGREILPRAMKLI